VSAADAFETLLARALIAGVRAVPWRASLGIGARLGDAAAMLGIRRRVGEENLARAFPERSASERARILREHYRELGRVAAEYPRLAELARAPDGRVVAEVRGGEHLERALEGGRGAILLSGHFGNFELLGARLARMNPVDFVVRAMANPGVEALLARQRAAAGVGLIPVERGARRALEALRANRWVALLMDQDAGRDGVFVPFLGRPASTVAGPARLALATRAPIVAGFVHRLADGRHVLEIDPPPELEDARAPGAVERLTACLAGRLERRVRERPEHWLWLHRRWKTRPDHPAGGAPGSAGSATSPAARA